MISVAFVLCILLFLWSKDITIYPVYFIENNLGCLDLTTSDWIIDTVISSTSLLLQLGFRLYLKYVKKMDESNDLISLKLIVFLICSYLSVVIFPLPTNASSYTIPFFLSFSISPTIILFNHSGLNQFFMENHPSFQAATSAVWHLMVQSYFKCKNLLSTSWDFLQENVLNICRSNQVQPYPISE